MKTAVALSSPHADRRPCSSHAKIPFRISARASTLRHTPHTAAGRQHDQAMHIAAQGIANKYLRNAACRNWLYKTTRSFCPPDAHVK